MNNRLLKELKKVLSKYIINNKLIRLLFIIVLIWVIGALLLWLFEYKVNPKEFSNFGESFWNMSIYLFSGLDKGAPVTVRGRLLVTFILIISLGIVGIFTATIASIFISDTLKGRSKMPSRGFKDHIIICNWNSEGIHLIKEMHNPVLKNIRPIVIVAKNIDKNELPEEDKDDIFKNVYIIKGDPTDNTMLNKACLNKAYSVIIISDLSHENYADSKSVLIALAVKNLNPDIYLIAEVQDINNVIHFKNAKIDELVSSSQLGVQLISQSAITHGITSIYNRLLTFSEETNEVYLVELPEEFIGKTFSELSIALSQIRDTEPVILVGVKRKDRIFINPKQEDFTSFKRDDELFVISFERPDLKQLVKR